MRRSFICACLVVAALALGARPQSAAACSMIAAPADQQARMVQDTIAGADLIVRGTVIGTRPIAANGRYYQQLTLAVAQSWRGVPAAQATVIGASLSTDTSLATTIGIFTGTGPQISCGGAQYRDGDDLLVFAAYDEHGTLRLVTATTPNDPLATTLRAQLGAGIVPPPSPAFPPFAPLILGAVADVALVGVHQRRSRWLRRG